MDEHRHSAGEGADWAGVDPWACPPASDSQQVGRQQHNRLDPGPGRGATCPHLERRTEENEDARRTERSRTSASGPGFMARPTGVGSALTAYGMPLEGRDEWVAAVARLMA
jgi:hypothetical protein